MLSAQSRGQRLFIEDRCALVWYGRQWNARDVSLFPETLRPVYDIAAAYMVSE
jgi:hypothetical protein